MNKKEIIQEFYNHFKEGAEERTVVTISQAEIFAALGSVGNETVNSPLLDMFRLMTAFFEEDDDLLLDAFIALLNHLESITPGRNCSCHMGNPPCSDCVDYSRHRELIQHGNHFLKERNVLKSPDEFEDDIII